MTYEVVFPSERVERIFHKALEKIPNEYKENIVHAIRSLGQNPRPQGKRIKRLKGHIPIAQFTAEYRLRVGPYRILYDIDDPRKRVVLLKVLKRGEHTYD